MKQILQREGKVTVEDVPAPAVPAGFVLVQTEVSLLSAGTERAAAQAAQKSLITRVIERPDRIRQVVDRIAAEGLSATIEGVRGRLAEPIALGYSASGRVMEAAGDVRGFKPGDRVACAGAGFANHAEIIAVPKNLCVPVPDGIAAEEAAFATVGAIALHGVRLAHVEVGETVAVIGLGLLGQLTAQIVAAAGARVVGVDLLADRMNLARTLGTDIVAAPGDALHLVNAMTGGTGADAVLITADTASNDPVELAGTIARDRSVVVAVGAVGLEVPRATYYTKELSLLVSRSYGPGRYDDEYEIEGRDYPIGYVRWTENRNLSAFLDLVARARVRVTPLITHRFPIESAIAAYDVISGTTGEPFLGVVVQYDGQPDGTRTLRATRGTVALPPRTAKETMPRLGVLGTGNFAKGVLLPAFKAAGAALGGVIARQGLNAKVCADRFGFDYFGTDESAVFGDPSIDAVAIATRHHLHAAQVLAAAAAAKDVFVEKPLCLTLAEMNEIARAFEGPGAPRLMVGFNRRFAPLSAPLKAHFADAAHPLMIDYRINAGAVPLSHWTQDPQQGGGRIIGEVCHFVDYCGWLVGASPATVMARPAASVGGAGDNLVIVITYVDGSVATVRYIAAGDPSQGKERIEVHGGGRSAVLDDFKDFETFRNGKRTSARHRFGQDKGHRNECAAFVNALVRGEPSPIPLHEILDSTRVTFLVVDSARSGAVLTVS